ncbi:UNKNOWN [Stylonychia lemnae]|uniref:FAM13A-like domain-containing protein n=1 Tax=Stylonychia lemnae TaxID=5949 RepID=A0A078A1S7_STYLE|nr:UNKNOWN [Stylonychia lemnae]|eukprot:CDW75418.1 UNKNOWN [Stylonychia lemnae]
MTGTVAQLFTINRTSHLKFFKNSSQLNESRIDIPMGRGSTSNLLQGDTQGGLMPQEWVSNQGKKFLQDSIERLQIDCKQYLFRGQPLSQLSFDDLNKIKRSVKSELKKYDQTFIALFSKQPAKTDKEPLRPLYMYYKKLKTLIVNAQRNGMRGGNNGGSGNVNQKDQPNNAQQQQQVSGQHRANSTTSNGSKQSSNYNYSIGSMTANNSRENSVTNQGSLTNAYANSLTLQDLNSNTAGVNPTIGNKKQPQEQPIVGKNNQVAQNVSSKQQSVDLGQQKQIGSRKNSAGQGATTVNHSTSNSLTQIDKDPQGRLMGVRGSVELKSINSVGGLVNNIGPHTTQSNSNSSGFAWTHSSKHQSLSQKAQSQKFQELGQNQAGYQQYSKNDMNNVRKSAQAVTMASLLDNNNLNYQQPSSQQQQVHNPTQESQKTVYAKNSQQQQQQQQFKQGSGPNVQQNYPGYQQQQPQAFDPRNQYMNQQVQQINFYHQNQQQQHHGVSNERKENINSNPYQFDEHKQTQIVNGNNLIGNNQKKEKRPNSASVGSQQQQQVLQQQPVQSNVMANKQRSQMQQQQQSQIQEIMIQIEEFKKERILLRSTLDNFRREFEKTNARRIKFKKDIKAVDHEFKRYKDLKEDINKLEKQLSLLRQ